MSIVQGPSFRANETIGAFLVVALNASTSASDFRCEIADTSTSLGFGVIQDSADVNASANIVTHGLGRAQCGASVSAGALLSWQTATGKVVEAVKSATTTAIRPTIGWAIQAGSTDSVISIYVQPTPAGMLGVAL